MKTLEQVMRHDVPTIGAGQTVADAVALLSKSDATALPVIEDGRLVGVITLRDLIRALPYRPVAEVMPRELVTAPPDMPLAAAYVLMEDRRITHLPVVEHDRLVGIVTREDVLGELGRPVDPLTDLPWSTTLRERAEQMLRSGHEIALLFLDLDNFGQVNKQLGHVMGDRLIKAVAKALAAQVDPSRDLLCRYGGDEFAILTTRPRDQAEALGRRALEAIASVEVPGGRTDLALSASLGIAGGKRTTERPDVHVGATIDDLITIASLQSTQTKIEKARVRAPLAEAAGGRQPRLRLQRFEFSVEGPKASATVHMSLGDRHVHGEARGSSLGNVPLTLLAEATVAAVNQVLPDGWTTAVDQVRLMQAPPDTIVIVTVLLSNGGTPSERHTGACLVGPDQGAGAVKATLHALNRRLGKIIR
jgi:diguanylate cyclase (GGDEF)-like protein